MHSQSALVFIDGHYNRYSIAVLTAAVESDERFQALDIYFVKNRKGARGRHTKSLAFYSELKELNERYQKLVIAFSFHSANIIELHETLPTLRNYLTKQTTHEVLFIAGGPHASGDPGGTLALGFDLVFIGEGERSLPNFLEKYFQGESYTDVKGLAYFDTEGIYRFSGSPDRVKLSDYPPFATRHRRFCPIEISRGCPWGCRYCQTPFFMGGRMRHRSLDSILNYTEYMKSQGLRVLRFISPASFAYGSPDGRTVNLDALKALLQGISGIYGKKLAFFGSFPSEVRPEQVSADTLALIREHCANDNLVIGAQSGSEELLQRIHRGHGTAEILRAVELTLATGLTANVDFIFGLPGETPRDREATLKLMQLLTKMGARIHAHAFMPLVGTPFAQCSPGRLDPETRRYITRLQGENLAHGRWTRQETRAQEIQRFQKTQNLTKSSTNA